MLTTMGSEIVLNRPRVFSSALNWRSTACSKRDARCNITTTMRSYLFHCWIHARQCRGCFRGFCRVQCRRHRQQSNAVECPELNAVVVCMAGSHSVVRSRDTRGQAPLALQDNPRHIVMNGNIHFSSEPTTQK